MRRLKETVVLMAAYYQRELSDEILLMYCEDLADLPEEKVVSAYHAYRRNPKNKMFPLPAQIRALVCPEVDHESAAKEIAMRITGAVVKFGWPGAADAEAYIGAVGWELVSRFGGWSHLCTNLGVTIDTTAFTAQVREAAKGALQFSREDFQRVLTGQGVGGGSGKPGELISMKDIMQSQIQKINPPK